MYAWLLVLLVLSNPALGQRLWEGVVKFGECLAGLHEIPLEADSESSPTDPRQGGAHFYTIY